MSNTNTDELTGEREIDVQRRKLAENYPDLRDQFAMSAMNGIIANASPSYGASMIASESYRIADAMLKQREKKKP
jgi:hypothetical protein